MEATALLLAEVYCISTEGMNRPKLISLINNVAVPKFKPRSGIKIAVTDQEAQAQAQTSTTESELKNLIASLPQLSELQDRKHKIHPLDFEKVSSFLTTLQ